MKRSLRFQQKYTKLTEKPKIRHYLNRSDHQQSLNHETPDGAQKLKHELTRTRTRHVPILDGYSNLLL